MTTRQNEIKRILEKLTGRQVDSQEIAHLANVAEAADIAPGDALFPLMIALDYYEKLYKGIPESIKETSGVVLNMQAERFRAEAEQIAEGQKKVINDQAGYAIQALTVWLQKVFPKYVSEELEKAASKAVYDPVQRASNRLEVATQHAREAMADIEAAAANLKSRAVGLIFSAALCGGVVGGALVAYLLRR